MATPKQFKDRGRGLIAALVLVFSLVVVATTSGAVWTDQQDYTPGSTVTISGDNSDGAGYLAGETVHVDVAGPNGWTADCDGLTDDAGAWSCDVTLVDTEEAVGHYDYTATGLQSEVTESGTFDDSGIFVRAIVGGTQTSITFPGDPAPPVGTVNGANASAKQFANSTCSGSPYKWNPSDVVTFGAPSTLFKLVAGLTTVTGESIQIQAPSPLTIGSNTYVFSSWQVSSNGSLQTTSTTNPACFNAWNAAAATQVQVNYVLGDTTPPDVTINSATPNPVIVPLSGSAPDLVVKWEADEAGTYKVVLGTDCTATAVTGTNTSGSYPTADTEVTTTIPASSLAFGSNTVTVCVTDAATNTGTDAVTVYKKAETALAYTGDTVVVDPANPIFKATLTDSTNPGCDVRGKTIDFFVDLTGDGDFDDSGESLGSANTATGSPATHNSAEATLTPAVDLALGIYVVYVEFDGTDECAASNNNSDAIVSVVSGNDASNGGGWYQITGVTGASKRVSFGYTTRWDSSAAGYRGQIVVHNRSAWRLKGEITAFAKSGTTYPLTGTLGGSARLYCWDGTNEDWILADSQVTFTASIYDTGPPPKKGTVKPDKFTVKTITGYTAGAGCPSSISPLVQSTLQELKGGNVNIKK